MGIITDDLLNNFYVGDFDSQSCKLIITFHNDEQWA